MVEPILSDNMEKAPTDIKIHFITVTTLTLTNKVILVELRKNIYHGTYNEDVVDHIAKVLKMVDLIYVPGVDSHQLRIKVFPLSLADDAKEWWISKGDEKITTWEELVKKFFCRFYPKSYDGEDEINELKESKYENPPNTATDSFFKAYEARDIEKQSQTKRKYGNTSNSINEQPNKRRCKAEKFEAIQYSLGPNEEYIAIRSYEYDIWERNEDNMSKIYQDIFQKKDEGWKVTPQQM
ncbi:reverse transcriptase domain-containing protein [Tanacetum coccineum]|uniref:Reverse transcriptase domain-containing protein n=1 Tax=Tanacetum coccineum TaxID=301880 RepID=A0ABQ5EBR4_9ASTR